MFLEFFLVNEDSVIRTCISDGRLLPFLTENKFCILILFFTRQTHTYSVTRISCRVYKLTPVLPFFQWEIIVDKVEISRFWKKNIVCWFFRVIFHEAKTIYMAKMVRPVSNYFFNNSDRFSPFQAQNYRKIIVLSYVWQPSLCTIWFYAKLWL